ncbi:hypothetical protein SAMN06265365_13042 [Tistlia consotensis]|uniref:nitric oxide dioxygenase n=1 Tax=Tistlia consotensis USBA 355 TaxID=560819 RepID=A0A1Y6CLM2_9PROT|nr:2Fe-2S iron-sulfur cluster-binding protein [Tistlia consotensis]SMF72589.1 hypothetical protein SAMN05428998_13142 [Tistlia consotensis USBA 355]SNS09462.1 hypothetical protein SAMN06265365_13042 [Tistlia consotensis]
MVAVLEIAGYAIVGGALLEVAFGLFGMLRRQVERARHDRAEEALFRRRSQALLSAAEARRETAELSWTGFRKFEIVDKVMEAEGICSFYLRPHDRMPLPPFEPGQHLTFRLRIPNQAKPVVRCYSLSEAPSRREVYRITIKRVPPPPNEPEAPPGLCSDFFHDSLQVGDIVEVQAPSGGFCLDRTRETPIVLIGGGIGLTPLLSMLNSIHDSGSEREVWFFYGARHGGEHVMKEHLRRIAAGAPNVHLVVCYSEPRAQDRLGEDYDRAGHISVAMMRERLGAANYDFYLCGPPPMMSSVTADLAEWGIPESAIHFEAFGPATVKRARPAASAESVTEVEVVFARSGKTARWTAEVGSLLDLAEANGVAIEFGCRAGSCGTCSTALREGEVDYLSRPGSPPERGSCLSCVAVPKGRIVLDA